MARRPLLVHTMLLGAAMTIAAVNPLAAAAETDSERCAALKSQNFSGIPEAASQVISTSWSEDGRYCEARGYVSSNVGFGLRLPAADAWNERFLFRGCGGFCGAVVTNRCEEAVNRGYACIVTDMGHTSTALDGKWAYNDREAEIDFAYRSTHVVAVAGKAITKEYYGKGLRYSYYHGCSTGGRQGMVQAQSFPSDFDGIIAGAPVIHETGAGVQLLWSVLANLDANGNNILNREDLPVLHAGALAQCDTLDGVKDGIIDDPRQCDFDPRSLVCSGGATESCLTAEQADVADKIYGGPVDAEGNSLHLGGLMPGSELNWVAYVGADGEPAPYYDFMADLFRYMAFSEDPGPSFDPRRFEFTTDLGRFGVMERLYSGTNPDLRRFQRTGAKLLVYHGWRDQSVIPFFSLDYYDMATRAMGGNRATQEFFRLFMIPGMNHCVGGPGPWEIDYLSAMEAWVERGEAPDSLIGRNTKNGEVVLERPILPQRGDGPD